MSAQTPETPPRENFLLRIHPLGRILVSIVCSVIAYFLLVRKNLDASLLTMSLWDVFALSFMITSWLIILGRNTQMIRRQARTQDGSRLFVFLFVIVAVLISLFIILQLLISKDFSGGAHLTSLVISISGMLLSWLMVHTVFTFHYAHIFYDNCKDPGQDDGGLNFPDDRQPDYLDFAYFAFVIGMTFQVSDVSISSRRIRHLALIHGLLSFGLNTFVVALAINFIAGLRH
ncbi:MAG: DUF1345 domain-containing protein [Bacteroidetes bacterium]|nr:MAG: DUF1345 domain-containing protein [Bacteroidota bacterium]